LYVPLSLVVVRADKVGADRSPSSRKSIKSRDNDNDESSWQYDGDNERPAPSDTNEPNGENSQMRWTKKQIRKGKQAVKTHLELPPSLGGDGDKSPGSRSRASSASRTPNKSPLPPDAVDLVIEDSSAIEEARMKERRKGEPQTKAPVHIYRHNHPGSPTDGVLEEVYENDGYSGVQKRSDFLTEEEEPVVMPDEVLEHIEAAPEGDTPWQKAKGGGSNGYKDEHNPWS
jgi:hypothetical protein